MDTDLPPSETTASRDRFDNFIAVAVALVSAFMAVSKIKDDNIVQAMQKARAETVDYWNEYRARRQRRFGVESAIEQARAADYDAGNERDDLFDLSDAMPSPSLALFAVTALTRVRWSFGLAPGLAGGGMVFGVAGFAGWTALHPDRPTALLG